jgi:hypothetical protein
MIMSMQRTIISISICGLLLSSISAARFASVGWRAATARVEAEACSLLTAADAKAALEVAKVSSKRIVDADPEGACGRMTRPRPTRAVAFG